MLLLQKKQLDLAYPRRYWHEELKKPKLVDDDCPLSHQRNLCEKNTKKFSIAKTTKPDWISSE
jgi:hypothetical protein